MEDCTVDASASPRSDSRASRDELIVRYEHAIEAEQAEQARYLKARLRFNDRLAEFDREFGR